tara:strand:- start:2210 stop:2359 length:150 start_codon:yes stop_codon:yes gene_type:complete
VKLNIKINEQEAEEVLELLRNLHELLLDLQDARTNAAASQSEEPTDPAR